MGCTRGSSTAPVSRARTAHPRRKSAALLRAIWHTPVGHILSGSLPVVGVNGTTRRIGKGTAAQGHCIAKTGTLDYVTNLAGYCRSRNGHMLSFALFLDGPSNEQSIALLSRLVAALAKF